MYHCNEDGRRHRLGADRKDMHVEMKIKGLMLDPITNMPIVILSDMEGQRILPIWVGFFEANAIALQMENVTTPRPMTHDLLKNILSGLNVSVKKILVNNLADNTFYALIYIETDGETVAIDSRPSDAIALALRMKSPIFVDEEVINKAKTVEGSRDLGDNESLQKWLENLRPEDLGKYKM
jgi:bifunctional DNase/RNase